jgi:hypothetical protein
MSHVLAWVCIGLAASLAGCIWPFHRGAAGLVVNALASLVGAVGAALVFASTVHGAWEAPVTLGVAAVGAIAMLLVVHAVYGLLWRPVAARHAARHAPHR